MLSPKQSIPAKKTIQAEPEEIGKRYEEELRSLDSDAFSWRGFQHEDSGIDLDVFLQQLRKYTAINAPLLGTVQSPPESIQALA
jgi:hypothetical protein